MRINGKARMACSALIDNLEQPIKLNRSPNSLWSAISRSTAPCSSRTENRQGMGAHRRHLRFGSGPRQLPQEQEIRYPLSNCISCTCCMEVCPQFNEATGFVGAATIAQVKFFNMRPTGKVLAEERLRALAGDGGIQECGYAQNCVEACPKSIPLTDAISDVGRDVMMQQVKDMLRS